MNRQQQHLSLALEHVQSVKGFDKDTWTIYGGLCHTLPVLVRTNGLCQTLAFIQQKAADKPPRGDAYKLLREHIAAKLDVALDPANPVQLIDAVRQAPLGDYIAYTRRLLDGWVYYKRFAVSILDVKSPQQDDNAP